MSEQSNCSKYKKQVIETCIICGKEFEKPLRSGSFSCPNCSGDKSKGFERPFTRDTVFLVCKWYDEGMAVKTIASILQRSENNVREALIKGGRISG